MRGLTPKQEKFALGLFEGKTQRQAFIDAYNPRYGRWQPPGECTGIDCHASLLANKPKIKAFLEALKSKIIEDNYIMPVKERMRKLSEIGRANLTDFVNEEGSVTLEAPNKGALQEVVVEETERGKRKKSVKLHNPIAAIQELNKMDHVYEANPNEGKVPIMNFVFILPDGTRLTPKELASGQRND